MSRRSTRSAMAPVQLSSPPATPTVKSSQNAGKNASSPQIKQEAISPAKTASNKRKLTTQKNEDDPLHSSIPSPESGTDTSPAKRRRPKSRTKTPIKHDPEEMETIAKKSGILSAADQSKKPSQMSAKKKLNYGLSPGTSPYPDYGRPTAAECHEVVKLLSKVHGRVSAPKEIRAPSLTTAGCGEVPSVLDALIRTRLSAATSGTNSSRAFQGLVKTFGTLKSGVGKGSVDWGAVRRATQQEVFEAIKIGGLANNKSKDIKEILDMVWEENKGRAAALKQEDSQQDGPAGAEHEESGEKKLEVSRVEDGIPSLDHLHLLSNEEAFNKLVSYPGIGPKTASCVLLFCLQRPSFAVDTHVFRLCRYLGWVPTDATAKEKGWPRVERNSTYAHCEVRVPDELKYALHQLLIRHGKTCGRCRAATGMGSEGWKKGCPIEHLVKRHGAKKGEWDDVEDAEGDVESGKKRGASKRGARKDDSESDEAEMSDLGSDEDEMSDLGSDGGEASDSSEPDDDDYGR